VIFHLYFISISSFKVGELMSHSDDSSDEEGTSRKEALDGVMNMHVIETSHAGRK
jgi:hypothetical protein